ncbi:hypothetical protein FRC07_011106 [Ceratobasidium sp. 392]|nr:hypothetical protein FRC07_011106 [Ceratobasidium sp. 392]
MFFNSSESDLVLSQALQNKGFRRKKIDTDDGSIPKNVMSNFSPGQKKWRMVYDPTGKDDDDSSNPVPDDGSDTGNQPSKGGELTVDNSKANEASIITTWNDGTNLPIVTTGDSIGARALSRIELLKDPKKPDPPSLGIFKVPHHGSQRNSQLNRTYEVSQTQSNKEKNHYLFLSLACWWLLPRIDKNDDNDAFYIRWAVDDVERNWRGEWIKAKPDDCSSPRDAIIFSVKLTEVSEAFWRFVVDSELRNTSTGLDIDLTNETNFQSFAVDLAKRHFELLQCIYRNDLNGADNVRKQDLLKDLKFEWPLPGRPKKFDFAPFQKYRLPEVPGERNPDGTPVINPECADLYRLLLDDPSAHTQYLAGMIEFYKRFRAANYAISANGEHRHPNANTIAALMTSAIESKDKKCRLFVTDAAPLNVDQIRTIVTNLLRERNDTIPVSLEHWRDRIGVYYLETDYCASIPSSDDLTDIAGCKELDFGSSDDSKPARDLLHQQFTQTSAYDHPRASEPRASSFEIRTSVKGRARTFSLSFNAATKTFQLADTTKTLFHLAPDVLSGSTNPSRYELFASPIDNSTHQDATTPSVVVFDIIKFTKGAATFYMVDDNGHVLSDTGDTNLQFQPKDDSAVRLQFVRKDGFGPLATDDAASLSLARPQSQPLAELHSPSFESKSSLERYLEDVGYQAGAKDLALAVLGAMIMGPDPLWAFFVNLPKSLTSTISLPTLLVDSQTTQIEYARTPFGLDVSYASIALVINSIPSMSIGSFSFAPVSATLDITGRYPDIFEVVLKYIVQFSLGSKKLQCAFAATSDGANPVLLDFAITGRSAPSDTLEFLGFGTSLPPLPIPLGGGNRDLKVALDTVGFTLVQPVVGSTGLLNLASVYFRISADWKPWEKVLPTQIYPKLTPDLSLTVALLKPKTGSSFTVGLQLDYALDVDTNHAKLLFRMSYWPIKGLANSHHTSVGFQSDNKSGLPPPSINDVLVKFTNTTWAQVTNSIPVLGSITKAISITQGLLGIDDGKKISGFLIRAQIRNLTLLSSPSLIIEAAELVVDYNGASWNGRFTSEFLLTDNFRFVAEIVLPSVNLPGSVSFKNLDDHFTCGELVKAIDPSIDLSTVPIVGGELLASLRLDRASLEITYADGKHFISGFMIALTWGDQDVGYLKTSKNDISISWRKDGTGSTWVVDWEGVLYTDWHLSASLQRSTIKPDEGPSKSVIILSGAVLDPISRIQSSSLIDSFTSSSPTSGSSWEQTVPKNVTGSFQLKESSVILVIGSESQNFAVSARATWGKGGEGIGLIMVNRSKPRSKSTLEWGFAFAVGVTNFRFTDIVLDSSLAQSIDDALAITRVSILVFRNPGNMGLSRIYRLVQNAATGGLIPDGLTLLPPESPEKRLSFEFTAGAVVFAVFNFPAAKQGSLTHNLNSISSSKLPCLEILGYFGKATDRTSTMIFTASISSIQLFTSVTLKEIKLTYAPAGSLNQTFSLAADCRIQFSSQSSWDISASLTITKVDANLIATLTSKSLTLQETLGLEISDIHFAVAYTFSTSGSKGSDNPPKSTISLGAKAQIGPVKAEVSVEFDSGSPGVLVVKVPGQLSVSSLFNRLFGTNISKDVLDITFSNFLMYYAWKAMKSSPGKSGPRSGSYTVGFHAEADTDVFGVLFSLAVDITGGDNKGISISGTKVTPVEVFCLTLHGTTVQTEGPRFRFSTRAKDKGCSIEAGLTLFGTNIGSIILAYDSQKSRFLGTVDIKAEFLPGGHASVSFELVKKGDKHVLRLVGLPAEYNDLIGADDIIDGIRKRSAKDKSPCGAIELAFNQLTTKLRVNVSIPDSQKGLSPEKGSEGASKLTLSVGGTLDIRVLKHTVTGIDFKPFLITVDIPKSFTLEAFGRSLRKTLKDSVDDIILGLWDNKIKLAEVIALVAFKKLGPKALTVLLCRGDYTPEKDPKDPPGPNQEPKSSDGGGADGDGLAGTEGEGTGSAGGGTAAADAAEAAGAAAAGLPEAILDLFGVVSDSGTTWHPPPRPLGPSGPPPAPPEDDVIGQFVHDAINKDFTRWTRCTDYQQALDTAVACALEYRNAISLLRKLLRSKLAVSNLGQRMYQDYIKRLDVLIYDFSMMSKQFAEQWLDMSDYELELNAYSSGSTGRKLDILWNNLRLKGPMVTAVTVQIEGESVPRLKLKSFGNSTTTTIDIPPLSTSKNLIIKAQVSVLGAAWGGDPKYAFFSQGNPSYAVLEESAASTQVLDFGTKFPKFTLDDDDDPLTASGNMHVFQLGSVRYWPMNYVDGRKAIGLVAQSIGTQSEITRWERDGDTSISSIQFDRSTVTFIGQYSHGVKFTFDELSLPDSQYIRTRVAIRDASSQPPLPESELSYARSVQDTKKYPVVLAGTKTWWPVLHSHSPTSISLVGYDSDLKFLNQVNWDMDSAGSGHIGRLNLILNERSPDNYRVEVYDTRGARVTIFSLEGLSDQDNEVDW